MKLNRRDFIKVSGAGIAALSLTQLGCSTLQAKEFTSHLKIEGTKEFISVCPFCSVSCHIIAHVKDGKLVSTEGDPDYPINEGALCAKGAAMLTLTSNDRRVSAPLYRAPFSDKWEKKSWDWTLNRLAQLVKETRDQGFTTTNAKGQRVNRAENLFTLGTSHMDNEECSLVHQGIRALGVVHVDHQARI